MIDESELKTEFVTPEHGWTEVKLNDGDKSYQFFPSDVPYDSFTELIKALLDILDGLPEAVVWWNDEPVEHKFVFTAREEQVVFKIHQITGSFSSPAKEKFSFTGKRYDVLQSFWKALHNMRSRQSSDEYERHWSWSFPEQEFQELRYKLNSLKNNPF